MPNKNKALNTIDRIIELLGELKMNLSDASQIPLPMTGEVVPARVLERAKAPNVVAAAVNSSGDDYGSFSALQVALQSSKWPEAVNPHLICDPNSHDDKIERGKGVIELMIEENLNGLKFLDYGCGEGQCAYVSADYNTDMSVGYDIVKNDNWDKMPPKSNLLFTSNFADVQTRGPFDVIVLFDVIDHLSSGNPVGVLKEAKSVLADTGKIYMRTHPFTSRHATHLYHDLNKAYIHLVFTKDELEQLIPNSQFKEHNLGVTTPIATYKQFIADAGLNILTKRDVTEKVESFFKIPKIAERIMKNTNMPSFPEFQMSLQFIDYVLTK